MIIQSPNLFLLKANRRRNNGGIGLCLFFNIAAMDRIMRKGLLTEYTERVPRLSYGRAVFRVYCR